MSDRLRSYKNTGKASELRERRTRETVELRKARKDDQLVKRRNIDTDEVDNGGMNILNENNCPDSPHLVVNEATLRNICEDLFSGVPDRQLLGAQTARKILSRERHPPIDIVIKAGIVPRCVEFLRDSSHPELQFESAWVLTNIASGTSAQTEEVVRAGAVQPFIQMLNSSHMNIVEQAIWALGNIAGDGPAMRDMVIKEGIVQPLVKLSKMHSSPTFLRNVAWTLSNICRAKSPPPPTEATRACLPALAHLISLEDMEVTADACWALSYLSDGANDKIEEVIRAGVVPRLVQLLGCKNMSVVTPCLRAVGNIVTGNDQQTQAVLKAGVLPHLARLLAPNNKTNIIKEAAWTVSNIAAGTLEQINMIVHSGIVPLLINILKIGDFRAQKEAIWAITNITSGGSVEHMIYLGEQGMIQSFCDLLSIRDWKTVVVILDGLENMLKGASEVGQVDKVACAIEECGGLDKIEQLQQHENTSVYEKAYRLIETYFSDENEEDPDLAPDRNISGDFQLSVATPENGYEL